MCLFTLIILLGYHDSGTSKYMYTGIDSRYINSDIDKSIMQNYQSRTNSQSSYNLPQKTNKKRNIETATAVEIANGIHTVFFSLLNNIKFFLIFPIRISKS